MEALIEVTKDGNSHSHSGTGNTAQYGKCCKNGVANPLPWEGSAWFIPDSRRGSVKHAG